MGQNTILGNRIYKQHKSIFLFFSRNAASETQQIVIQVVISQFPPLITQLTGDNVVKK